MSKSVPVIIYQMGKVGSTAIYKALSPIFDEVYQVHSLVPAKLEKTSRILREKGLGTPKHVMDSRYIIDRYISTGSSIKIITPIRSALQRNMSAFFQELSTEVILKDELRKGLQINSIIKQIRILPIPNEWKNLLIQKAIQSKLVKHIDFLIDYFKTTYRHRIPLDWFDVEFKEAIGLNVFQFPFNHKLGYQLYANNNYEILIFKSELSNDIKSKIISEFTGDAISIKSEHTSDSKSYGQAYKLFKERISTDDEFLSTYLNSKYGDKFYLEI